MTPNVGGTWDENPAQMRQLQGFHSWKVGTGTTLVNAGGAFGLGWRLSGSGGLFDWTFFMKVGSILLCRLSTCAW